VRCEICGKKTVCNRYCDAHSEAYKNIAKMYAAWEKALEVSWKEYLSEIAKNQSTGKWAKEVAEHLIKYGEEKDDT
jgi:hypothetical protein